MNRAGAVISVVFVAVCFVRFHRNCGEAITQKLVLGSVSFKMDSRLTAVVHANLFLLLNTL